MGKINRSIEIEASPEEVFNFQNDVDKMNEANKGFIESKMTSEGPVGVGSTTHVVGTASGQHVEMDVEVTEFVKNKRKAERTTGNSKYRSDTLITLEPTDKGTKFTYSIDYKLPYSVLGIIADKLSFHKDLDKGIERSMENVKKCVEGN